MRDIAAAEQTLTIKDVLQGYRRILQDVIHREKFRRASLARLAMEVQPNVLGQALVKLHKLVDSSGRGPYMIGRRNALVAKPCGLDKLLLRLRLFHEDLVLIEGILLPAEMRDRHHLPCRAMDALHLVGERLFLRQAHIAPIVLTVPADRDSVEETVRLLTQVDDADRHLRLLGKRFQQGLQAARRKLPAARCVETLKPLARRHIGIVHVLLVRSMELILHRAEVARQPLHIIGVDAPDIAGIAHARRRLRLLRLGSRSPEDEQRRRTETRQRLHLHLHVPFLPSLFFKLRALSLRKRCQKKRDAKR